MTSICSRVFTSPSRPAEVNLSMRVMEVAKKVTFVALAAFAWTLNASHFLLGFAAGASWSLLTPSTETGHCHHSGGGCSDGALEALSGIQLPNPVGLAAGTAILWTHLDHHPFPFVLLLGFHAGALAGRNIRAL